MNQYELYITGGRDPIGYGFVENIIHAANLGAKLKEGTLPRMTFPQSITMVIESELPPTPAAWMRVFEVDSRKEVFATLEKTEPSEFSMDAEDEEKDLSTNDAGEPWTREQLDGMTWDQVKAVGKSVGVTGRDREKVIKGYFEKVSTSE